jgi:hypothetical protein
MRRDTLIVKIAMMLLLMVAPKALGAEPVIFPKPLSPRIANYDMEARLDPKDRTVHGHETLTWRNSTLQQIGELQFHLYPNAFRNNKSSFMKESGEKAWKPLKKDGWGYLEIERIELDSGQDLTGAMAFIHPDDDNADDRTVVRLPLPEPVAPGESVSLVIDFITRLPEPSVARSGAKDEYFFVSQWFPKIGVFEGGHWNCHQYHSTTEFFADFGVYNVRITVPEKDLVGATGIEVEVKPNGDGTATHYFHAEDVHDFAWTASPRFVEFTDTAENVAIRVLMQKERAYQGQRHLAAARLAVEYFHKWYGTYPYPNLTVVDPRAGASGTGGMEYPTLITAGTWFGLPQGVLAPEMVIIHEFGHNYWYHLVASNEFEEAWLDEGINTYCEIRIMEDIYGKGSMINLPGLKIDDLYVRRYSYVMAPDHDPIVKNAWQYYNHASYRSMAYSKPALMLMTLENYVGTETMRQILRAYFERFKFKHPVTRDFIAVADEVAGQDLSWFFEQALYSNADLDYSVDYVSSEKVPAGTGFDYTLEAPDGTALPEPGGGDLEEMFLSVVKIRRLGDFHFPVEVEMTFADGSTVREQWDGVEPWIEYRYLRPMKLIKAQVDPDRKVALDLNYKNNEMSAARNPREKGGLYSLDTLKYLLDPH